MNYIRKALSATGGIFLSVLSIAALAPKATRGVAAALVQVVNPTSNPVNVSESPADVFLVSCVAPASGATENSCSIAIPTGKRLVVQTVSLFIATDPGVRAFDGSVRGIANGLSAGIVFGVPFTASSDGLDISTTTQELRYYADSKFAPLTCTAGLTQISANGEFSCGVAGYLVDAP
jgi:hypothetical protein